MLATFSLPHHLPVVHGFTESRFHDSEVNDHIG